MVNEKTDPDICMKRGRIVFSVLFSSSLLWFSEFLLASDCTAVAENVDACEITVDSIPASRVPSTTAADSAIRNPLFSWRSSEHAVLNAEYMVSQSTSASRRGR